MSRKVLYGHRLRTHQTAVLDHVGGYVGVSAVPGSGKTFTLALLAAQLIIEGQIGPEAEVLVVTVQNSAVDNISQRIRQMLKDQQLPPVGFHVCTLHKLASDILRERYDLAGIEGTFSVVDEAESRRTMQNAVNVWVGRHRAWWESYLPSDGGERRRAKAADKWRRETARVGREATRICKHLRLSPEEAQELLSRAPERGEFLPMGLELYGHYARYLQTRNGLDFDDLIWRAIEALEQDAAFLTNLRTRWPYILEDEAQDSSPLQEMILERLSGTAGNWVRVGDPNQAINSTFTSADPRFFRRFLDRPEVISLELLESGRSARPIIRLANQLVTWTCEAHPEPEIRRTAFKLQFISPTEPGDPQPNPPDKACHIHLRPEPYPETEAEAEDVARWAASYVRRHEDRTVAILCPARWQGGKVVAALETSHPSVPYDDLLRSTPQTRAVAKVLAAGCRYLGTMTSRQELANLYSTLQESGHLGEALATGPRLRHRNTLLRSLAPQDLLFPRPRGSLDTTDVASLFHEQVEVTTEDALALCRFGELVARWVRACALAIDQLILTVAQDVFRDEADLAICQTIAASMRAISEMHPDWRLADFANELGEIAANRRSFANLSIADAGYTPQPGRVVVTTMHKAKGLEWDAVYLISVDSLEFPDTRQDSFRDEPYFMLGRAPAVEAATRLRHLAADLLPEDQARAAGYLGRRTSDHPRRPNSPLEAGRLEFIAERLRLLYVGITRARRDLAITWSERNGSRPVRQAAALCALRDWMDAATGGDQP